MYQTLIAMFLSGSDTAQGFLDAEESNGHAVDNTFFKYMCGKQNL